MSEINYTYVKGKGWVPEASPESLSEDGWRNFYWRGQTWRLKKVDTVSAEYRSWVTPLTIDLMTISNLQEYADSRWHSHRNGPGGRPGFERSYISPLGTRRNLYCIQRVA